MDLETVRENFAGKPAIYVFSPDMIEDAYLSITLSREWRFINTYPIQVVQRHRQEQTSTATWNFETTTDGNLLDYQTNTLASYLTWEAETRIGELGTQESVLDLITETCDDTFNPLNPLMLFDTLLVLEFDHFIPYLQEQLTILGLTLPMRTNFMVHWLPAFMDIRERGRNIAFRFVNQNAIKRAARMTLKGIRPAVVARIFLLFKGVPKTDEFWKGRKVGLKKAKKVNWAERIGLDAEKLEKLKDPALVRVMEIGGMQVAETV